ncbi:aldose 1-epimerase family protein [Parapedobacter tibetensis]|uniref:aldose 1-epimerase family protein n=1 Tax=Parapedobacter tibetensis TaxID=2972951 RepID=UPI00214DC785|nr:aldose 1-epimerase family protein [Parapedobacter tibetensis]
MIIENEFLQAEINAKGAELKSLKNTITHYEYMWGADPAYWAKTSPVLFPIVGALKDDTYYHEGKAYNLTRHGFARDFLFAEERLSDAEAVFSLSDNEKTRLHYPFAFRLSIRYRLEEDSLFCSYEVSNPEDRHTLPFSIGGHPAFAVGTDGNPPYHNHYLEFPDDDVLHCHLLEGNLITDRTITIPLENRRLLLRHELFYGDALVMKGLRSKQITLKNKVDERGIHFRHEGFPYFDIWAAKDADFVCLEPWCGIADGIQHNQQFDTKEGIQVLKAGETWRRGWEVACF